MFFKKQSVDLPDHWKFKTSISLLHLSEKAECEEKVDCEWRNQDFL